MSSSVLGVVFLVPAGAVPAMQVARALGKPVVMNYRSGEAPDHLRGRPWPDARSAGST